jgi:hypothetical protein
MDALSPLQSGRFNLLIAPRSVGNRLVSVLIARLALEAPVCVLDGGNCFDVLSIARAVRRWTHQLDAVLRRISIARAFTCYQVVSLLAEQRTGESPILALDLLDTFADENVSLVERSRLMKQSIHYLEHLAGQAPVLVTATPVTAPPASEYLERLSTVAGQTWQLEPPDAPVGFQARLPGLEPPAAACSTATLPPGIRAIQSQNAAIGDASLWAPGRQSHASPWECFAAFAVFLSNSRLSNRHLYSPQHSLPSGK